MDSSSKQERPLALSRDIAIPTSALTFGQLLGEGGFGKVYAGQWRPTALFEIPVAIKQLKQGHLSAQVQSEFEAEVSVHATLKSLSIVKLYGVSLEQPYCMVMEYMPNQSLDKYLQNNQRNTTTILSKLIVRITLDFTAILPSFDNIRLFSASYSLICGETVGLANQSFVASMRSLMGRNQ